MNRYHTILLTIFLSFVVTLPASRPACALAPVSENDETLKEFQALTETVQLDAKGTYLFGVFELGQSRMADVLAQTDSILHSGEIAHSGNRIVAAQRLLLRECANDSNTVPSAISSDRSEDLQFLTGTVPELKQKTGSDFFAKFLRLLASCEIKSLRRMADVLQKENVTVSFVSPAQMEKDLTELGILDWKLLQKSGCLLAPNTPGGQYRILIRDDLSNAEMLRILIHEMSHYALEAAGLHFRPLEKEQIAVNNELILCHALGLPVQKRYVGYDGQTCLLRDLRKILGAKGSRQLERVWFDAKKIIPLPLPETLIDDLEIGPEEIQSAERWKRADAATKQILQTILQEVVGGKVDRMTTGLESMKGQFKTQSGVPGKTTLIVMKIMRLYKKHPRAAGRKGQALWNRLILAEIAGIEKVEKADYVLSLPESILGELRVDFKRIAAREAWKSADQATQKIIRAVIDEVLEGDPEKLHLGFENKRFQFQPVSGGAGETTLVLHNIIRAYESHPQAQGRRRKVLWEQFILPQIVGVQKPAHMERKADYVLSLPESILENLKIDKKKAGDLEAWRGPDQAVKKIMHVILSEVGEGDPKKITTGLTIKGFQFQKDAGGAGRIFLVVQKIVHLYASHPGAMGRRGQTLLHDFILPEIAGIEVEHKADFILPLKGKLLDDMTVDPKAIDAEEGWTKSDAAVKQIILAILKILGNDPQKLTMTLLQYTFQFEREEGGAGRTLGVVAKIVRAYEKHPRAGGRKMQALWDELILPEIAGIQKEKQVVRQADHILSLSDKILDDLEIDAAKINTLEGWKRTDTAVKKILGAIMAELLNGKAKKMTTALASKKFQFQSGTGGVGKETVVVNRIMRLYEKHPNSQGRKGQVLWDEFILPEIAQIQKEKESSKKKIHILSLPEGILQDLDIDSGKKDTLDGWTQSDKAVKRIVEAMLQETLRGKEEKLTTGLMHDKFQFQKEAGGSGEAVSIIGKIMRSYERHPYAAGRKGPALWYEFILPKIAGVKQQIKNRKASFGLKQVDHELSLSENVLDALKIDTERLEDMEAWRLSDEAVKVIIEAILKEALDGDSNRLTFSLRDDKFQFRKGDGALGKATLVITNILWSYARHPHAGGRKGKALFEEFVLPEIAKIPMKQKEGKKLVYDLPLSDGLLSDLKIDPETMYSQEGWEKSDAAVKRIMQCIVQETLSGEKEKLTTTITGRTFRFRGKSGNAGKEMLVLRAILKSYERHPLAEGRKGKILWNDFLLPKIAGIEKEKKSPRTVDYLLSIRESELEALKVDPKTMNTLEGWEQANAAASNILQAILNEALDGDSKKLNVGLIQKIFQFRQEDGNPGKSLMVVAKILHLYEKHPKAAGKEGRVLWDEFILPEIANIQKDESLKRKAWELSLKERVLEDLEMGSDKVHSLESWQRSNMAVKQIVGAILRETLRGKHEKLRMSLVGVKFQFKKESGEPGRTLLVIHKILQSYARHPWARGRKRLALWYELVLPEIAGIKQAIMPLGERDADYVLSLPEELLNDLRVDKEKIEQLDAWKLSDNAVRKIIGCIWEEALDKNADKLTVTLMPKRFQFKKNDGSLGKMANVVQKIMALYESHPLAAGRKASALWYDFILPKIAGLTLDIKSRKPRIEPKEADHVLPLPEGVLDALKIDKERSEEPAAWTQADAVVKEIVEAILRDALGGDIRKLTIGLMRKRFQFLAEDGSLGKTVLIIANILWSYERHPKAGGRTGKALWDEFILPEIVGIDRQLVGNETRLREFAQERDILDLVNMFSDSPRDLEDLLEVLHAEIHGFQRDQIVRGFARLNLGEGFLPSGERRGVADPWAWEAEFINALFHRQAILERLNESKMRVVQEIYRRLVQREFEIHYDAAKARLEEKLAKPVSPQIKALYSYALQYFEEGRAFTPKGIKRGMDLHLYQKIGAKFLVDHDQAILADEQGLGKTVQAIAAAETLGLKRILVITPHRVKDTWKEILQKFTYNKPEDIFIVNSAAAARPGGLDKAKTARYVIVNYEFLRKKSREQLQEMFPDLDLVILDEVQKADNPSDAVQQAAAVRQIHPKRKWLLSSTPYNNKPAYMFTLLKYLFPEKYGTFKEFEKIFAEDATGLRLLSHELSGVMLRRRQRDVVYEYDPVLHPGQTVWVPKRVNVPLNYTLNEEQLDIIARMFGDFRAWAESYNSLPTTKSEQRIDLENINPFIRLNFLIKATIDPRWVGGKTRSPLYNVVSKAMEEKLAKGEKGLIFANHRAMVDAWVELLRRYGVARMDGKVRGYAMGPDGHFVLDEDGQKMLAQTYERHRFQEDPKVQLMVANVNSGSLGMSLTAADVMAFAEIPMTFVQIYQAMFRTFRVDSRKQKVDVMQIVAQYPAEFVRGIADPSLRAKFEAGTVLQILTEILRNDEGDYRLIMDGMEDEKAYEIGLVEGLAGRIPGFISVKDRVRGRRAKREAIAREYYELWTKAKSEEERKVVLRVATQFLHQEVSPQALLEQIHAIPDFQIADMGVIEGMFDHPNKFLRDRLIKHLSKRLLEMYQAGQSLSSQKEQWAEVKDRYRYLWVPLILSTSSWQRGPPEAMQSMLDSLLRGAHPTDDAHRLYIALAHVVDRQGNFFAQFLDNNTRLFADSAVSVDRKLKVLERLSILKRVDRESYEELCRASMDSMDQMEDLLRSRYLGPMAREFGVLNDAQTDEKILALHARWGHFDQIYGLLSSLRQEPQKHARELEILKRIMRDILDGTYKEKRSKDWSGRIGYLGNYGESFWDIWNEDAQSIYADVKVEEKEKARRILKSWDVLARWVEESTVVCAEDRVTIHQDGPDALKKIARDAQMAEDLIGKCYGRMKDGEDNVLKSGEEDFLRDVGLWSFMGDNEKYKAKMEELRPKYLLRQYWARVKLAVESSKKSEPIDKGPVLADLRRLYREYLRMRAKKEMLDALTQLENDFKAYGGTTTYRKIKIWDTDDAQWILERGELHQRLINCFNYSGGNPEQTKTLVGFLAGRNQRLIVAEDEEHGILSVSAVKVRKTVDGRPTLFLERGIYRGGEDFEQQMLEHLAKKAAQMQPGPSVTYQARPEKEGDIRVQDTGNVAAEYVEALYGVRRADQKITHSARVYKPGASEAPAIQDKSPTIARFFSVGTGQKTFPAFLKELKDAGVKVLVDVRSKPGSKMYPHFNKGALAWRLAEAGIRYVWMGDDLGGYQTGYSGAQGFTRYMKENPAGRFTRGLEALRRIAFTGEDITAVMCSESEPHGCHRTQILEALEKEKPQAAGVSEDLDVEIVQRGQLTFVFEGAM